MGEHPFLGYPLGGLDAARYRAVSEAGLAQAAQHPSLARAIVGLLHWDPAVRMSLDAAAESLFFEHDCPDGGSGSVDGGRPTFTLFLSCGIHGVQLSPSLDLRSLNAI